MYTYVLELQNGNYWVGYTDSMYRICSLINGAESLPKLVKAHPAKALIQMHQIPTGTDFRTFTDGIIEQMRVKYGAENVNGHTSVDASRDANQRFAAPRTTRFPKEAQITDADKEALEKITDTTGSLLDLMK